MGRRSLLTPQRQERILQLIQGGMYIEQVCRDVAISTSTFHAWRARGQQARDHLHDSTSMQSALASWHRCQQQSKPLTKAARRYDGWSERPYLEFLDALERAEVEPERDALLRLRMAGAGGQLVERRTTQLPDGSVETVEKYTRPQWQALAWFLERRFRERWQRSSEMVHLLGQQLPDEEDSLLQVVDELAAIREQRAAGMVPAQALPAPAAETEGGQ